jgi:hypothetical protein
MGIVQMSKSNQPKEPNKGTHEFRVLKMLKKGVPITYKKMLNETGSIHCNKAIQRLREAGFDIQDEWISGLNKYGDDVTYKIFFLGSREQAFQPEIFA